MSPEVAHQAVSDDSPRNTLLRSDDTLDAFLIWKTLWAGRRLISMIAACFVAISVAYVVLAAKWFRAEVHMVQSESVTPQGLEGILGAAGGLANLVGINVRPSSTVEPLAVLRSRVFAREFIEDQNLIPLLFPEWWDPEENRWKTRLTGGPPDITDAVEYFDEKVRTVTEDKRTGLVTLTIEWRDPELAASWANLLVERLNGRMRDRALSDAEANVAYLKSELAASQLLAMQQSVGRLLEVELQKVMIARVNREAAFRVVDPAVAPNWHSRPKRAQTVVLVSAIGLIFGCLVVLLRHLIRERRRTA